MVVKEGGKILSPQEVLSLIPQQRPFRFIDEILEINENGAVGRYTYRPNEFFYEGHFPGNPVTPGVILVETMAQVGLVALGIYLIALEYPLDDVRRHLTFFTESENEFSHVVKPNDQVTITAERVSWRHKKLKSKAQILLADGTLAASSTLGGLGVLLDDK
jgi:3-hydroxyacyl-[acyl-carrier-protein] dehydratase